MLLGAVWKNMVQLWTATFETDSNPRKKDTVRDIAERVRACSACRDFSRTGMCESHEALLNATMDEEPLELPEVVETPSDEGEDG